VPVTHEVKLDTHAPTVVRRPSGDTCSLPGRNEWCRGTQSAGFTASDATSGLATLCLDLFASCDFSRVNGSEGAAVTISSGRICDVAGNCTPGVDAGPFQVDATPPSLAPAIAPTPVLLHAAAVARSNATDAVSGLATQGCTPVDTTTAGMHTLTCTASDNAGNQTTASLPYLVAYELLGFFPPATHAKWKPGKTVPVTFALADANGARISDAEARSLLAPTCRVTFRVSGAQTLSACPTYDATANQFVYTWKLGLGTGPATIAASVSYPGTSTETKLTLAITIG
jgi:hypothetical protein